jgi:hypothetical protein
VRGIITWHPYLFTPPEYLLRAGRTPGGAGDLNQLRLLCADTVVLDPFNGDPAETTRPEATWRALATVAEHRTE